MRGNGMKSELIFAFIVLSVGLYAQNDFSDFAAEDGSGIGKIQKLHKTNAGKKAVYTTHDTVNDCCEDVQLVTILLDEAVMKHVRKLSAEEGMVVLKSHQLWWKYFDSTPSLPNVNGSGRGIHSLIIDSARIQSRWEALRLPYKQYLVYAKIANLCQVRLNCGTFKMRFGEVCLKKEACWAYDDRAVKIYGKYYHSFPARLLPETCRIIDDAGTTYYSAVLKNLKSHFFCVWDSKGKPRAVYVLADVEKISSVTVSDDNIATIVYLDKQKKEVKNSFQLKQVNETAIPSEYEFSVFY